MRRPILALLFLAGFLVAMVGLRAEPPKDTHELADRLEQVIDELFITKTDPIDQAAYVNFKLRMYCLKVDCKKEFGHDGR